MTIFNLLLLLNLIIFLLLFSFVTYIKKSLLQLFIITEFISSIYLYLYIYICLNIYIVQCMAISLLFITLIAIKASIVISLIINFIQGKNITKLLI